MDDDAIRLSHGSGRGLSDLLHDIILPSLLPGRRGVLEDAALFDAHEGTMAFTSDSFVVWPLEFRGGDIGKLSACGTINDLAMMGARPLFLSVSLILEEGLDIKLLSRILASLRGVCEETGVVIACGDTKVVDRGKADGMFISTSGIGVVAPGRALSAGNALEGDAVLVSGSARTPCSKAVPSPSLNVTDDFASANSANDPSHPPTPGTRLSRQMFSRPIRHIRHLPQETRGIIVTRSPRRMSPTSRPTSTTVPASSCPRTTGGFRNGCLPRKAWRSDPHTPAQANRMRTSSLAGRRSSTSRTSIRPVSSRMAAFMDSPFFVNGVRADHADARRLSAARPRP